MSLILTHKITVVGLICSLEYKVRFPDKIMHKCQFYRQMKDTCNSNQQNESVENTIRLKAA